MKDKRYLNCKYLDAGMDGMLCSMSLCTTCKEFKGEKCPYYTPKNKMKDKEKQIEEMAKDWDYVGHLLRFNDCYMLSLKQWSEPAREMIKLGWTKPNKDSVVLSREDIKNLANLEIGDWASTASIRKIANAVEKQARKETAEKCNSILEKNYKDWLKVLNDLNIDTSNKNILVSIVCGLFKNSQEEIAKQFGVEIKE